MSRPITSYRPVTVTRTGIYGPFGTPKECLRLGCPPCTTGTETVISANVESALTPITLDRTLMP